jgi:hypothetical protein
MMVSWLVSNLHTAPAGLSEIARTREFRLWGQPEAAITCRIEDEDVHFLLTGYILPRLGHGGTVSGEADLRMLPELWTRYGRELPRYVKGIFTLLVISRGVLHLFGDSSGYSKTFLWRSGDELVLSNSLAELAKAVETEADVDAIAAHTLLHHYVGGTTFLRGVESLPAAVRLRYDGNLHIEQYWSFAKLLDRSQQPRPYREVAEELVRILQGYYSYLRPEGVHLTLTGGLDSRTVLAASLRHGVEPATYTYGDAASLDVVTARRVAQALGLAHANPRPDRKTPEWYEALAWEIAAAGNGLAHIHRAHRLDSVVRQPHLSRGRQMLLLGTMGGEGIRGAHLNDLIVTEFVRRSWEGGVSRSRLMDGIFERYYLRSELVDRARVGAILDRLPLFGDDPKRNEFHAMYDLVAAIHHAQDIGLYAGYVRYVVPIFMDVDYLELLFSTPYSMLHKQNMSASQLDRLNIPEFSCNLIRHLHPQLARLPLGSGHTPQDYLRSRLLYILKKGFRKHVMPRPPANFPYGKWFQVFVERQLEEAIANSSGLGGLFNMEAALQDVRAGNHPPGELPWHRFSNIVLHWMLERTYLRHGATV